MTLRIHVSNIHNSYWNAIDIVQKMVHLDFFATCSKRLEEEQHVTSIQPLAIIERTSILPTKQLASNGVSGCSSEQDWHRSEMCWASFRITLTARKSSPIKVHYFDAELRTRLNIHASIKSRYVGRAQNRILGLQLGPVLKCHLALWQLGCLLSYFGERGSMGQRRGV